MKKNPDLIPRPKKLTIDELEAERARVIGEMRDMLSGDVELDEREADEYDTLEARVDEIDEQLADSRRAVERMRRLADMPGCTESSGPGWDNEKTKTAQRASLTGQKILARSDSLRDWAIDNGEITREQAGQDLSFDKYIRGIARGNWRGAELERAMAEGTATAGGHFVPAPIAAQVIDLARPQARVLEAGATVVPMPSQTLKIPKLTNEGSPDWRLENTQILPEDLVIGEVTLSAKSIGRLVVVSNELLEDAPAVGGVIAQAFAAQFAAELDRVALRGTGTNPEPRGILNTAGVTVANHGANGATFGGYDWLLDAAGTIAANGFQPTAHILAPRTSLALSKAKDSAGNYLTAPSTLLPILPTRQVPIDTTQGTSNDTSQIFTGAWPLLAIGIRSQFSLKVLSERYADWNQTGFLATMRADVAVLQTGAFVVDTGVRP